MKKLLFLLLSVLLLSSCPNSVDSGGNGADPNPGGNPNPGGSGEKPARAFSVVDIVGAHTLYVAPKKSSTTASMRSYKDGSSDEPDDVLYSIDDEGKIEEVPFLDENNEPIVVSTEVKYVVNVNDDYVLMESVLKNDWGNTFRDVILTRKSDGAVFSMEAAGYPVVDYDKKGPFFVVSGDYLYLYTSQEEHSGGGQSIKKVNLSTTDLTVQTVGEEMESWSSNSSFHVDENGNIAYSLGHVGTTNKFRVVKPDGGFYDEIGDLVCTLSGKIFAFATINEEGIDENGYPTYTSTDRFSSISIPKDSESYNLVHDEYQIIRDESYYFQIGTNLIMSRGKTLLATYQGSVQEIDQNAKTLTVHTYGVSGTWRTENVISDNYFYVLETEQKTIARTSLTDFTVQKIDMGRYIPKTISVSSKDGTDDVVMFSGQDRNNITANILAEMTLNASGGIVGEVKILEDSGVPDTIVLERIN